MKQKMTFWITMALKTHLILLQYTLGEATPTLFHLKLIKTIWIYDFIMWLRLSEWINTL